jgi:hypothetical protein
MHARKKAAEVEGDTGRWGKHTRTAFHYREPPVFSRHNVDRAAHLRQVVARVVLDKRLDERGFAHTRRPLKHQGIHTVKNQTQTPQNDMLLVFLTFHNSLYLLD